MNSLKKWLVLASFGGLILFAGTNFLATRNSPKPAPKMERTSLAQAVDQALAGTKGTYGVVVKNLKTGEKYAANDHLSFAAGSLYKIWVLATAFDETEQGNLDPEEVLSRDVAFLNAEFGISPDSAELTEGTVTLTVHQAMEQMVIISHNYAALMLLERLKLSTIQNFNEKHGFKETTLGESPETTPSDVALFFEKLYQGELANQENTQEMLAILKKQTRSDKLTASLPPEAAVAHKSGEIDYFTHDAGIVFGPKSDYVIAVLSESGFPPDAEARIAAVSKAVYEYFER